MKTLLITSLSFLIGVVLTLVFMDADYSKIKDEIPLVINMFTMLFTLFTVIIAFSALKTWKFQINHQSIYDAASELEKALTKFLIISVSEGGLTENNEIVDVNQAIQVARFILIQRQFEPEVIKRIENNMRNAIVEIKDSGRVSSDTHGKLLSASNDLSLKINKRFS